MYVCYVSIRLMYKRVGSREKTGHIGFCICYIHWRPTVAGYTEHNIETSISMQCLTSNRKIFFSDSSTFVVHDDYKMYLKKNSAYMKLTAVVILPPHPHVLLQTPLLKN